MGIVQPGGDRVTLAEFLTTCLDEDERRAQLLDEHLSGHDRPYDPTDPTDPARVLADIAAKRAIIGLHRQSECVNCQDVGRRPATSCAICHHDDEPLTGPSYRGTCATMRALAQPYAGRDDWDETWRTDN